MFGKQRGSFQPNKRHPVARGKRKVILSIACIICLFVGISLISIGLKIKGTGKPTADVSDGYTEMQIERVSKKQLTFTIDGKDITAFYTGALYENIPYGEGIYEFNDANGPWSFLGSCQNGSFYNGIMIDYPYAITLEDEESYSKYTGAFFQGRPSGDGTYEIVTKGNTALLEGNFDPETGFSGNASNLIMSFAYNGFTFSGLYSGEYRNGVPDGTGSFSSHGALFFNYDGIWDSGKIVGPGNLYTNNAQINVNGSLARATYNGELEKAAFNGNGTISVVRDNAAYSYFGEWKDNLYSGKGTLTVTNENGIGYTYTGDWKNGVYDGEGQLLFDSDDIVKYVGHFEKGEFRPTFSQLITCLCSAENSKLELNDYVSRYIEEHQTEFVNHSPIFTATEPLFSYDRFIELQDETTGTCFNVPIRIIQSVKYETDIFGYPVTEFIGSDRENRLYYGYYIGYFENIASGDTATITAFPLGYAAYKSQDETEISALRFLAFSVVK